MTENFYFLYEISWNEMEVGVRIYQFMVMEGFNMRKTALLTAAIAGFSFSGIAMTEVFSFIEMPLTASQEAVTSPTPTPAPDSNGYGRITAFYDNNTKVLTYNVNWKLDGDNIPRTHESGNNHIHGPAAVGTSAPIVIPFPDLPLAQIRAMYQVR
jgi:hypothetical protein